MSDSVGAMGTPEVFGGKRGELWPVAAFFRTIAAPVLRDAVTEKDIGQPCPIKGAVASIGKNMDSFNTMATLPLWRSAAAAPMTIKEAPFDPTALPLLSCLISRSGKQSGQATKEDGGGNTACGSG